MSEYDARSGLIGSAVEIVSTGPGKAAADTLAEIRKRLESIVCTGGCDAGIVLLCQEGRTHTETVTGRPMQVYDHEYFSPLGDALIDLYKLAGGTVDD